MQKTVQNVKNSLKFKAQEKDGILSVKVGVKKFVLPVQSRILSDSQYLFLSFPASSELYRVEGKKLVPLDKDDDATAAFEQLNPARKRGGGRRRSAAAEIPPEVAEALKGLPTGYRLGYDATGNLKLIRTRKRKGK
jgi:hypothetical protein